jgi:hypothetical protein
MKNLAEYIRNASDDGQELVDGLFEIARDDDASTIARAVALAALLARTDDSWRPEGK